MIAFFGCTVLLTWNSLPVYSQMALSIFNTISDPLARGLRLSPVNHYLRTDGDQTLQVHASVLVKLHPIT
jgi:hypothetical protein